MHTAISIKRLLKVGVPKYQNTKTGYDAVRLFIYKGYVLCCPKLHLLGDHIINSHIIQSRDFPFLSLAVLVATLLVGMKFCESYVVATVDLYM